MYILLALSSMPLLSHGCLVESSRGALLIAGLQVDIVCLFEVYFTLLHLQQYVYDF